MAHQASPRRRGDHRLRLDRRDHGPGTDRRRPERAGHRARRLARHADRFRPDLRPGRAALLLAPRAVPAAQPRHADHPQQASETALPMRQLGSFLPGTGVGGAGVHWNGQVWRFLPSDLKAHEPQPAALRQGLRPRRHDHPGLWRQLRRAGALLRQVRISLRRLGQGRQPEGRDPARRRPVRGPALAANIPTRRSTCPMPPTLFAQAAAELGHHPFPHPAANMPAAPTPTRWACSSAPAPTAASARSSAAATIPRPAPRPPSCRC